MIVTMFASLLAVAVADSHDNLTQKEFASESQGKWVFLDMYAEW